MENSNRENENDTDGRKPLSGKSCKGCLFYSSVLNPKSKSPFCVGLSRTLKQGKDCSIVEIGQEQLVTWTFVSIICLQYPSGLGRHSGDVQCSFMYACVGYSVHHEKNIHSTEPEKQLVELPFCVGIEILSVKKGSNPDRAPAHFRKGKVQEDGRTSSPLPQSPRREPMQVPSNGFMYRFTKNAEVVAMGVKRNLLRVSNHIKKKMDNALDPYKRRSK